MISLMKRIRKARRPRCAALVVAAGSARRMGGVNKLLLDLDGAPVLARTLSALQLAERVDEIVVAVREEDIQEIAYLCKRYGITKCTRVTAGGRDRVESALKAAMAVRKGTALLAVHDGARPLVTPELINRVIAQAARTGAAAPAIPVKDTVKRVREDGTVEETLDRNTLRAIQTPQVFQADVLKAALQAAREKKYAVTDDCSAVERLGKVVWLVEGDEENLKITTPLDLTLARAILDRRKAEAVQSAAAPANRTEDSAMQDGSASQQADSERRDGNASQQVDSEKRDGNASQQSVETEESDGKTGGEAAT
ncbi:MAG: 2-C-methyl-D-erythritol 4-phosphate cytidylyltransferase [Oscillibacter sp.]|nr:2-C-methyl-D-erythritol 4-phosphate cytidylyltransferase [Oscillibacter sp.]